MKPFDRPREPFRDVHPLGYRFILLVLSVLGAAAILFGGSILATAAAGGFVQERPVAAAARLLGALGFVVAGTCTITAMYRAWTLEERFDRSRIMLAASLSLLAGGALLIAGLHWGGS